MASISWWLAALALHIVCVHGAAGDDLATLDSDHSLIDVSRADHAVLSSANKQTGHRRDHQSRSIVSSLAESLGNGTTGNKTAPPLDQNSGNKTAPPLNQTSGNKTAPPLNQNSTGSAEITGLQKKSAHVAEKAIAQAQSDAAKVQASATKKILKQAAKKERKDAANSAAEAASVMKQKSGAQTNDEAMTRIRNKARKLKLKQIYTDHVQIALKAKEYLHKVKSGAKEAKLANATVERLESTAQGSMEAEISERMVKAKSRIAATEAAAATKADRAVPEVPSDKETPDDAKTKPKAAQAQADENGDQGPMAKDELQKAVSDAQLAAKQAKLQPGNQTAERLAATALTQVSQATQALKGAVAHDKDVRSEMSSELNAKMRSVKSSSLLKQKKEEIVEQKAEEADKLNRLEKQRVIKQLEAYRKNKKGDAKLNDKLDAEKEKRLGLKLKQKLLKAEDGVRTDNLKLKEKEEAKNLKSKESDFKASERTREIAQKRKGEDREAKEKKTEVSREKEKSRAENDKHRIKVLFKDLVELGQKLEKDQKKEEDKMKEAALMVEKANDKDMVQTMGISGSALEKKLKQRSVAVAKKAKKDMKEASDQEEVDKKRIVDKIRKLQKNIIKSKSKAALDKVKLGSFKAQDQATLASEEKEHQKREMGKYKKKLQSKEYKAQLKAKLINELKGQIKQEVEGPYRQKLEAKLRRQLTAEIKSELASDMRAKTGVEKQVSKLKDRVETLESKLGSVDSKAEQESSRSDSKGNRASGAGGAPEMTQSQKGPQTDQAINKETNSVDQFALQAAENAAATAAVQEVQKEQDVQEGQHSDGTDDKEKFDWNTQSAYWSKQERMNIETDAAARDAKALIRHVAQRAKTSLLHLHQKQEKNVL